MTAKGGATLTFLSALRWQPFSSTEQGAVMMYGRICVIGEGCRIFFKVIVSTLCWFRDTVTVDFGCDSLAIVGLLVGISVASMYSILKIELVRLCQVSRRTRPPIPESQPFIMFPLP